MDELLELSRNCKYVTQYKQIFEMTCFFLSIKPPSKVYELCRVTLQHFLKIFLYEKLDRERNQETKKEYRKAKQEGKIYQDIMVQVRMDRQKKVISRDKIVSKNAKKERRKHRYFIFLRAFRLLSFMLS